MTATDRINLSDYIRDIPDFPKPGIIFKDITPLLHAPEAFRHVTDALIERYRDKGLTAIVAVESRGFMFAAPVAYALGLPLVPARKPGKLPYKTISETYDLEYGSATLEVHEDALKQGDRVLLVDDLLATGGTLGACCRLINRLGAEVAEIATIIELTFLNGREKLCGLPFYTMMKF